MTDGGFSPAITLRDVEQAAARIRAATVKTPIVSNERINRLVGAEVFLKAETLQRTGAFKFRGAYNSMRSLPEDQRRAGVVTYSSGNHGQALAQAASLVGSSSVIVMPSDAPAAKIAATTSAGAEVVHYDRYTQSREQIAAEIAAAQGRLIIPPYDWPDVMAGQGTVALELFEQVDDIDALVVCLGGGGLLAGCATVANAVSSDTKIFGVEPAAGDDHRLSRAAGERVVIDVPVTIADGQQTVAPGVLTWPINERYTTDFLAVSDDEIVSAMRLLFEEAKLVVEPSGATAFAAVLRGRVPVAGRIGVTLSGGNIDLARFTELIAAHPAPTSRPG